MTTTRASSSFVRRRVSRVDVWMALSFSCGGLRVKRQSLCLLPLRLFGLVPLVFMAPALITLNVATMQGSVADTLGTGAEINLLLTLLVTPMATLTTWRWILPLRRWYGITFAVTALTDAITASITTSFAGGVAGRVAGHTFLLIGLTMALISLPLLITANEWARGRMGRYWKTLQRFTYLIWGLLFVHLALLEGFGFQTGANGSGFCGSETAPAGACTSSYEQILHQRLYQLTACSLFLLVLRLPPVRQWVMEKQKAGETWKAWAALSPLIVLFVVGFAFIVNELMFKGIDSFRLTPSNELCPTG